MNNDRLHFIMFTPYYPPHIGGLENYAAELADQLAQREHTVTVITTRLPASSPRSEQPQANLTIYRLPAFEIVSGFPAPALWSPQWWKVCKFPRGPQPAIIVSHTRFFLTSLLAGISARLQRRPWIHIEHGSAFVHVQNPLVTIAARLYDATLGQLTLRSVDDVIAISKAVARFVENLSDRSPTIIYRGLPQSKIDEAPPWQPNNAPAGKMLITSIGRLVAWKGFSTAIQAVQTLPETDQRKLWYVVAGSGPDADHLNSLINRESQTIKLVGALSAKQAIGLLKKSDIYLHASQPGGGLSTALLEAMYCGCAIIATPHEGADEFIIPNQTGLIVPAQNPAALGQAIQQLMADSQLRRQLGMAARQRVQKYISWDRSANALIQHVRHLVL